MKIAVHDCNRLPGTRRTLAYTVIPSTASETACEPGTGLAVEGICFSLFPREQQIPRSAKSICAEEVDVVAERGMTVRGIAGSTLLRKDLVATLYLQL